MFALVDDRDFDFLNQYNWRLGTKGYAETKINRSTIGMHRLLLDITTKGIETDHIDHNKLNNQRVNLRACTISQNQHNRKPRGKSRFLGVKVLKGKFNAAIFHNGKTLHLGRFDKEQDAALAYDKAAKQFHGEFANLNFK